MPNRHQTDASVEDSDLARILRRDRRRVVCGFLALALTWILGSDFAVKALAPDLATAMLWQTFKGTLFVIVSAVVLAMLLRPLAQHVLHAHARLRASEVRYRAMFQGNPGPILVYNMDTMQVLDVNPAACSLFGWTREEFKALQVNALWAPSHDAAMQAQLDHVRAHPDEQCVTDGPLLLKDGSLRHMEMRSNGIRWGGHRARLFIAVDRSSEELALQRRDQALGRLEEAHEMARIGAWELDPASGMGRYSRQIYHLLGRRPPQARHWHRFEELLIPADPATAAHCENLLEQMRAEDGVQIDVLLPLLALDGHQVMAHIRAESGIDEQGRPRVLGTLQDVSEREHSRRLLREREEQFRELVRVLPDGVIILSDEHVLYANTCAAAQFGHGPHALLGEPLPQLVALVDLARLRTHLAGSRQRSDMSLIFTARMRRADGSRFQAGLSVGDVRYGGRDCKLLIVRDLSDSERTRAALETSNRELQAMAGRLFSLQEDERRAISRDLHDDIGQAITAMKLAAHAASDEPDPRRRGEDLQQIVAMADSTVSKLRNLAMLLRPPQLDALGLEAALRWQAGMLFRSSSVDLDVDIHALPRRPANEVEQACFRIAQESLTNVLRHAHAGQVQLHLHHVEDHGLLLQVSDDGDGFEPEGPRGLGLIVMRERAQSAGGHLDIRSAPGAGTTITLQLPYDLPVTTLQDALE